jgi:hypothetical protein
MKETFKDKLISETLDFYKISSLLDYDEEDFEEGDFDFNEPEPEYEDYPEYEEENDDEFNLHDEPFDSEGRDFDDEEFSEEETAFGEEEFDQEESPNEGLIRTVRGAYMVYKKLTSTNNYEELWIYNTGDIKKQTKTRNSILAGTDIDPVTLRSPDNDQYATITSTGNVQFLHIDGLPN